MFARLARLATAAARTPPPAADPVEQVGLAELNALLDALAAVFPAHDVALLRTLLLDASPESRLHIAANALLQHPEQHADRQTRPAPGPVAAWEQFRSDKYRAAVEKLLTAEFQGLATSAVRNVLAEHNHDYARSRAALGDIAAKSWRFSVATWLARRRAPPPLPRLDVVKRPTGCARLDDEIYALGRPARDAQAARDGDVARALNEAEYAAPGALLECECCFGDCAWEDLVACTAGHLFCRACLDRCVQEALFGQGPRAGLRPAQASVACISAAAAPACRGVVAPALLAHALPAATLARLEEHFAREALRGAALPLVRCPACAYAVVDGAPAARVRPAAALALVLLLHLAALGLRLAARALRHPLALPGVLASLLLCGARGARPAAALAGVRRAATRVRRRRAGVRQQFTCAHPRCGLASCIECGRAWTPFHDCRRADSERLYVERAMTAAVKRTCPQCRTSFVKADGCNKLTCPCGYQMCYVCRADVRRAQYWHFCTHFRAVPGTPCGECARCSLYEAEDEQAVAAAAAARAAEEWAARGGAAGGTFYGDAAWPLWAEQHVERLVELVLEW